MRDDNTHVDDNCPLDRELLHAVGCMGLMSHPHSPSEQEAIGTLQQLGYVKKVVGDWMLTEAGVKLWHDLFDVVARDGDHHPIGLQRVD